MCIDCCRASKLFKACDQDDSGTIDLEEFGALLKEVDDTLEIDQIKETFKDIGASHELDEDEFYLWNKKIFGECTDSQFTKEMIQLLNATKMRRDGESFVTFQQEKQRKATDDKFKREW